MNRLQLVRFNDQAYKIPLEQYERFEYLRRKILYAEENGWVEMERGYTVVLKGEFKGYRVDE